MLKIITANGAGLNLVRAQLEGLNMDFLSFGEK
jgi:hypothetical protein